MASRVLTRKQKGTIAGNFLWYRTEIYVYNIEAAKHHIYYGLSYGKECRIWPHMTTHNEVHPCLTQLSEIPPPAQLHSSYYCILSFVPSNDGDNCFVPFCWCFFLFLCTLLCCAQRIRVKWGRKRANAHNCSLCWECMRLQTHSVQNPSSFTWDRMDLSVCKPFHYGRSGNCLFLCGAEWALKEWGIKPPTCIPLWRTNAIYHKDSDYHRRRFMFVLVGAQNLTWHTARVSAT